MKEQDKMKKLMIAACAVAFAAVAQAATVNWSVEETLLGGDKEGWDGPKPTANQFDVYLFDGQAVSYAAVKAAIEAGTGADYLKVADGAALAYATLGAGGGFSKTGTTVTDYTSGGKYVDVFAVLVDKTPDQYAFVIDQQTFEVGDAAVYAALNNTGLGKDYNGYVFAGTYANAGTAGSNWYSQAVPEPTSGLLLLLGVAGLALKRRRA